MGVVRTEARGSRGIMAARSYRRLKRYSNSARYRGTCFWSIARYVPTMAALMFPSAVLTHLKPGVRAAAAPEPVLTTSWAHPALATAPKQARASLTTLQEGSRLRLAKFAIE